MAIRLHLAADLASGRRVVPAPEQARYLLQVMRLAAGDELLVFNGRDGEWRARIAEAGKRGCVLELVSLERPQEAGPDLDLLVAVVKRDRLETIVEKAAELGARRVQPVLTERTNLVGNVRLDRLLAIATEAAEQTGRLDVPEVLAPLRLTEVLEAWDAPRKLMFCDEAAPLASATLALTEAGTPGPWAILIGPEGGFSPAEQRRLRDLSFGVTVALGPRVLRADTAAISAMTLWQAALGDWS